MLKIKLKIKHLKLNLKLKIKHTDDIKQKCEDNAGKCKPNREIMYDRTREKVLWASQLATHGIKVSEWESRISPLKWQRWHILKN